MIRRAIGPAFVLALLTGAASAQGVDYYEFRQLEKRLEQSEGELQRLSNAVSGGDFLTRLEQVKGEISRVTNELEQLEFRMRQHEQQSKQKLEDLEYRIIELEGGDPSILFQSDDPVQPQFLEAGASGCLTKHCSVEEIADAVRAVVLGERYISADIARQMALSMLPGSVQSPFDLLSQREVQVLMMVAQGQGVHDISERLCLSSKTVSTYRYRLFEKLGVENDVELTRLAIRHGIVGIAAEA